MTPQVLSAQHIACLTTIKLLLEVLAMQASTCKGVIQAKLRIMPTHRLLEEHVHGRLPTF